MPPSRHPKSRPGGRRLATVGAVAALAAVALSGCGSTPAAVAPTGTVPVVAAENQYGSIAAQIGGRYVRVVSVEKNPNTDPHSYEVSPSVARQVAGAAVLIQNGLGYDSFMNRLESASPTRGRRVIDVQHLLRLPDSTPNPHLWYSPATMPVVARALAADLAGLRPAHAAYFRSNLARFNASLGPWRDAIARFRAHHAGTAAATTEPVADYLLAAMGIRNLTPFAFQADVMNGTDPTPQYIAEEDSFFSGHRVKVFVYNQQVADPLTSSFRAAARRAGIPVVGVYETMPAPGYDYQSWMLAETTAIADAVTAGKSTVHL